MWLRPYAADDLDHLAAMYADAEVTAYTRLGRQDRAQTAATLDEYLATWRDHGWGMRAMWRKPDGAYLGECGLFLHPRGGSALRYALMRPFWGAGYVAEAVRATIDDAFTRAKLPRLLSFVQRRNLASLRVMQRLGWEAVQHDRDAEVAQFAVTRAQWLARATAA